MGEIGCGGGRVTTEVRSDREYSRTVLSAGGAASTWNVFVLKLCSGESTTAVVLTARDVSNWCTVVSFLGCRKAR